MKQINILCLIPFLFTFLLTGCSSSQTDKNAKTYSDGTYCINGGRANNYSCNHTASQAAPMHTRTVDEVWMYETLEEIKDWLEEEKSRRNQSATSP